MKKLIALTAALSLSFTAQATLIEESFTGVFDDDNARFYVNFEVTQDNTQVTLESFGYAGGINAAGEQIADGGFDSQLFLFDSAGVELQSNDDGSNRVSSISGFSYDALINRVLSIGTYTVALTQFNSDYVSGDLFTGNWTNQGNQNFGGRTSAYAFDISGTNLTNISPVGFNTTPTNVSEPTTLALIGLSAFGFAARRRKQK